MSEQPEMYAVTCRTEGCIGEGWTLVLMHRPDIVTCGGCSQDITDIQPPLPELEVEPNEETEEEEGT